MAVSPLAISPGLFLSSFVDCEDLNWFTGIGLFILHVYLGMIMSTEQDSALEVTQHVLCVLMSSHTP